MSANILDVVKERFQGREEELQKAFEVLEKKEQETRKKIYVIFHNSWEWDDVSYGDATPVFFTLSEEKCKEEFEKLRERELKHFEEVKAKHPDSSDYEIAENEKDSFKIYMGNWGYEWFYDDYELDKWH